MTITGNTVLIDPSDFETGLTGQDFDEGAEVLDAQRKLFDAELIYAQSQSDVYTSFVTMYKVMGGGWVLEAEEMTKQ